MMVVLKTLLIINQPSQFITKAFLKCFHLCALLFFISLSHDIIRFITNHIVKKKKITTVSISN